MNCYYRVGQNQFPYCKIPCYYRYSIKINNDDDDDDDNNNNNNFKMLKEVILHRNYMKVSPADKDYGLT
jgi:hypothetical protein